MRYNKLTAQTCEKEKYPVHTVIQRVPDGAIGAARGWRMDF